MHENREEIFRLAAYLTDLGVRRYFLLHEDMIGRHSSHASSFPEYHAFYEALREEMGNRLDTGFVAASGFYKYADQEFGRCDAGITKIAVMPDGSVFPCNLLAGSRNFFLGTFSGMALRRSGITRSWSISVLIVLKTFVSIKSVGILKPAPADVRHTAISFMVQ